MTERDKSLHKDVIDFLNVQLNLISHFSEIINLELDHFIRYIKEVALTPRYNNENTPPTKEYQLALNELPMLELGGEKWFFFKNHEFIYFNNFPYALILELHPIRSSYEYKDGYIPNNTILDIDMLEKVMALINKNIKVSEMELTKNRSQYSHAFFNVVMIEIERLNMLSQRLLDDVVKFIQKNKRENVLKPLDGHDRLYQRTNTVRMQSWGDVKTGKTSEYDELLFSSTHNLKEILEAFIEDFSRDKEVE